MLVVLGVVVARQRRLKTSRQRPVELPNAPQVDDRPRAHPRGAARFTPAPIDAGR